MGITLISIETVAQLLVLELIGFIAAKLNILTDERIKSLSHILSTLLLTAMYISIGFREYKTELLGSIVFCFVISFIAQIAGTLLANLVIKKKNNPRWQVERASAYASNVGFIGTAIVSTMLGGDALIIMIGTVLSCNIILFTLGEWTIAEKMNKESVLKFLKSPMFISIVIGIGLYITRIPVPKFISAPINSIGNMTGTIAMIVAGAMLAKTDLKSLLKNKNVYLVLIIRLIISPLFAILLFKLLPARDEMVYFTIIATTACPVCSLVPILAENHGKDSAYASGILSISLLLTAASIPLLFAFYSLI